MPSTLTSQTFIDEIMKAWQVRAYAELPSALGMSIPILENAITGYLVQMYDALFHSGEQICEKQIRLDLNRAFARQHGTMRAETINYPLPELIKEFHILREVVIDVLENAGELTEPRRDLVLNSIDDTVSAAATEYTLNQKQVQERFTLTLAHDLRNPLGVVKLCAGLIPQTLNEPESCKLIAQKITRSVDRLEAMIRELLDVARVRAGQMFNLEFHETRLDLVAKEVVAQLAEVHGNRFEIDAGAPITGIWNREGLARVIENLAVNALKYGSATAPVRITVKDAGNLALLTVHNEGNPIPPEDQAKLFETFSRAGTTASKSGWGLGLALVKGMVDAHSGKLRVESSLEHGTSFIVELPK